MCGIIKGNSMRNFDGNVLAGVRAAGATTINDEGDEVLAGLTVFESQFFLSFNQAPNDGHSIAESNLFVHLRRRHIVAWSTQLLEDVTPPGDQDKDTPAQ